jgi:RNA-binding protein YhbY
MKFSVVKFQIGKNGLTPAVLDTIVLTFKNKKQIRISMLKSSGRNHDSIEDTAKQISQYLVEKTKYSYNYRIIGFTIILNKESKI